MRTRFLCASVWMGLSVAIGLIAPLGIPFAAASQQSQSSVSTFMASARHGLTGTYTEVYRVTGPNGGTVSVFQQAHSGEFPFTTGPGRWSFLFQAQSGISSQWIEHGSTSWDCWRPATDTTWSCSGPGHFEETNGFFQSVEPYIPGVMMGELNQLQTGIKERAPEVKNLVISESSSPQFGPLRCLTADGTTACIDRTGVLVNQHGSGYWSSIMLVRRSPLVPATAFNLVSKSTSDGKNFTAVPS